MECIITIELGTNAIRVYAFDLNGITIGSLKGYCPTFHSEPDHSEQDPDQIFITMLYVLKNLLNDVLHPKKYKVLCICFSSSMHSILPVDKTGSPMGNAITWADNRANKEAAQLKNSALGKKIYNSTGTPLHPMSPLAKIAWIKNNEMAKFKQVSKFLSLKSYILQQLTGEYMTDYSIASATGLLNIHKIKWDPDSMRFAGIKPSMLPDLVPVFTRAGKLNKAYQTSLGLSADTKILVGSSDGCMATLGDGVSGEGVANITVEDSGAIRVMGDKVLQDEKQRFFNYLLTENRYVSGGPTNNGGIIFEWFTRQFGDFKNPFDIEQNMLELIAQASKIPAGSGGLLFLPYLLGERAPIWNANARGVFFGLNITHEKAHFVRAAIEGILYEIYSIGKTLQEHRNFKSLSINGSFGTLPIFSQMIADIFNKPVRLRQNYHSVSYGSYLLAATEMGIYKSLEEAAKSVKLTELITPNKKNHKPYIKHYEIFERLSTKLSSEFADIVALQHP
ncbi:MAG: gluconokinase [Bacteroidota bacterium]|nr:gluconokinase [Bacteroidota bacterium]MDP4218268.1 gluconokinase [Bacteroidota bacterium]MDP4245224.1 gluconokinase [Bacteroidota bacterium]MDP4256104.1 gluconokinase [Bacteroidota bacterium]MDP4257228.1 gluconokinase [Bacteroidota bacterium]